MIEDKQEFGQIIWKIQELQAMYKCIQVMIMDKQRSIETDRERAQV